MPSLRHIWYRMRWSLYAPFYDAIARRFDDGRRRSIELAAPSAGERVLIVGGGTGLDLPHLPRDVEVVLTDTSTAMLRRANARAEQLGRGEVTSCCRMDAQRLDLPDDAFDVVLLHLILAVVPDPERVVREAARVVGPSGRVAIYDKFAADASQPSLMRRLVAPLVRWLATDINRRLGPLVGAANLRIEQQEPSVLGGLFKVAIARPTASDAPQESADASRPATS